MSAQEQTQAPIERTMTPFGDTVVLELLPDYDPSRRIILPEGARVRYDRAKRATVVDVGPNVRGLLPSYEVLVAPMHDGVEISVPGTGKATGRFRVVGVKAIIAVLSADPDPEVILAAVDRCYRELQRIGRQMPSEQHLALLSKLHAQTNAAIAEELG